MSNIEQKIEKSLIEKYQIVISAFLAGTGIVMYAMTIIFNPMADTRKDIALIQKDINVIQTNHEAHMQKAEENVEKLQIESNEQSKQIIILMQKLSDHLSEK